MAIELAGVDEGYQRFLGVKGSILVHFPVFDALYDAARYFNNLYPLALLRRHHLKQVDEAFGRGDFVIDRAANGDSRIEFELQPVRLVTELLAYILYWSWFSNITGGSSDTSA